jgi:2'-5' RNA ligase
MSETAIVVEVPEAELLVGFLRREHTPDGAEGLPAHLTILYPFTDTDVLVAGRIRRVCKVLESFSPFDFALCGTGRFPTTTHTVLYLAVEPPEPFIALTEALAAEFPEHPPFGGQFDAIVPHLTVAISPDRDLLDQIEEQVLPQLPIRARTREVALFEQGETGWSRHTGFQLREP